MRSRTRKINRRVMRDVPRVISPVCPYCDSTAVLAPSARVYGTVKYGGKVWLCPNYPECDSYVGTHGNSERWMPVGTMANKQLRKKRIQAHAAFDPLWQNGRMTRNAAYKWLAAQMQMPVNEVHVGHFDMGMCEAVIEICRTGAAT